MASIRPLERSDVPAVAQLLRSNLGGSFDLHEDFLSATLLDDPWADSELPSLVAIGEGGVPVGFVGAQVRRMRVGDRALRAVCCSHLAVTPEARAGATGALLLRRLLSGPQDLTWSDTANDVVARMWVVFGGYTDHMRACDWMLVLRPGRWTYGALSALALSRRVSRDVVPVGAMPLHAAGRHLVRRAFPVTEPPVTSEPASPSAIGEHTPRFAGRGSLRPDHDADHLEHVFGLVERTVGPLETRLVLRDGDPIGWYAVVGRGSGAGRVIHIAGQDADLDAVVGELAAHARRSGLAVLSGRFEPHLEDPLRRRLAVLGLARRPVMHTRDAELVGLLGSGSSLITQLDGEWYAL